MDAVDKIKKGASGRACANGRPDRLIARSKSRGKVTLARLHEKAPDLRHTVHYADLTRISEMKRVAVEIASQEPRIDVLINNAGVMLSRRRLTEARLDNFALNHMAYFVVTEGLPDRAHHSGSRKSLYDHPRPYDRPAAATSARLRGRH
jgi:retinol dehydrogenase 12